MLDNVLGRKNDANSRLPVKQMLDGRCAPRKAWLFLLVKVQYR